MMKYSQWARLACAVLILFSLSLLLSACGGGGGSTASNPNNSTSGGTPGCQSSGGQTTSMCSGTPTSGNDSGTSNAGIDTNNAAGIANAVVDAISTSFDLGGNNNTLSGLITAVQTQDMVKTFNLTDFALQQLSLARDRLNQSLLNSPQVIALQADGRLNLACPSGGSAQQTPTNPDPANVNIVNISVNFQNCVEKGITYDGILDITNITGIPSTTLPAWDRSALFTFSGLTVKSSKLNIVLSGAMLFESASLDGLTGTSTITINANNNSNNTQNSLGTTLKITENTSGITDTLSVFTLTDTFNLTSPPEQHMLIIRGNLEINGPGNIFNLSIDTPFDLVTNQTGGPFSSGTLIIVAGDGSQLTVKVESSTAVTLTLTGPTTFTKPIPWTVLLSTTLL